MPYSDKVLREFLMHPETNGMLREKIHGGVLRDVHRKVGSHIDNYFNEIENEMKNKGGSISTGGSIYTGGEMSPKKHKMSEGEHISSHKDAYHFLLNLTPAEYECLREIASQLIGGMPSPMWGDYRHKEEKLEAPIEHYQRFIDMHHPHHAARLVEAEYGVGKGGSFLKTVKHIARKASKLYNIGHNALNVVNRNKDLLLSIPGVDKYKKPISSFLDTATRIDEAVNPIVEATIDATKANATPADKQKLKNLAEQSIKKVVAENVPRGNEWVNLYDQIKRQSLEDKQKFNPVD